MNRSPVPSMRADLSENGRVGLWPIEVSAVPFKYKGDDGALGFVRDISRRKKAEASLRESEEKYRLLAPECPGRHLHHPGRGDQVPQPQGGGNGSAWATGSRGPCRSTASSIRKTGPPLAGEAAGGGRPGRGPVPS